MEFKFDSIHDVVVKPIRKHPDKRGWLAETFRWDELSEEFYPRMGYISQSLPGITRGPHEHIDQADYFVFLGPGSFKIWLWDNRPASPTYRNKMVFFGGEEKPTSVLIPAGVVHAYRNMSDGISVVQNFPNRLFMGEGKKHPIDELRHEDDPKSPFKAD